MSYFVFFPPMCLRRLETIYLSFLQWQKCLQIKIVGTIFSFFSLLQTFPSTVRLNNSCTLPSTTHQARRWKRKCKCHRSSVWPEVKKEGGKEVYWKLVSKERRSITLERGKKRLGKAERQLCLLCHGAFDCPGGDGSSTKWLIIMEVIDAQRLDSMRSTDTLRSPLGSCHSWPAWVILVEADRLIRRAEVTAADGAANAWSSFAYCLVLLLDGQESGSFNLQPGKNRQITFFSALTAKGHFNLVNTPCFA